ncbi:hypothetical protein B0H17DRAFT_1212623 [Mycena rosella]|uniref:Uncharacterized protein n=1 Tax=Mycena rosella TaxID=1033263 RepID=A0AAD7CRU1_MYCRO|nr:hypothetical protein B0H17DRAFT_1212623 [Mycena rosella]
MADEAPPPYNNSSVDAKHDSGSNSKSSDVRVSALRTSNSLALLRAGQDGSGPSSRHSPTKGLFDRFRRRPSHSAAERPSKDSVVTAIEEDVRMLVQPSTTDSVDDRLALLDACAQLSKLYEMDFSLLLQKRSIHDHSVLYWAIVNSPWPLRAPFDLVAAVLAQSAPLAPKTIREARLACVSLRNQEMFQFLRMCPEFGALFSDDRFILGAAVPPEEIVVETMEGPMQPFSVRFRIPLYEKRMLLSREIKLEFIARGRLWQLTFFTATNPIQKWLKDGQWSGSLRLGDNTGSLNTHAEFGLVFLDTRPAPPIPVHAWAHGSSDKPLIGSSDKPGVSGVTAWSWPMFGEDSVWIAADGSITGVLGVKLGAAKVPTPRTTWPETIPTTPDDECVVC